MHVSALGGGTQVRVESAQKAKEIRVELDKGVGVIK